MWSVGVVAYMLLSGRAPFFGDKASQSANIKAGRYSMSSERWSKVSEEAKCFVRRLLEVDPSKRLSAQEALEHPWLCRSAGTQLPDHMAEVSRRLCDFSRLSKFRQHCMRTLAWSLPNDSLAKASRYFAVCDVKQEGVIKLSDLQSVLADLLPDLDASELQAAIQALDYNRDQTIHYSDFLAALVGTEIELDSDILAHAFRNFDKFDHGEMSRDNAECPSDNVDLNELANLLKEASFSIYTANSADESSDVAKLTEPVVQMASMKENSFLNLVELPIATVFDAFLPKWIQNCKWVAGCVPFVLS
jgi:calcium-dependent protein kinase